MHSIPDNKKVLLTGASGFLGWHTAKSAPANILLHGTYHRSPVTEPANLTPHFLDLAEAESIHALLDKVQPGAVIHLAAVSDTTRCEQKPAATRLINVDAANLLAEWCSARQLPFVFASSDLVFDGELAPYQPGHTAIPVNEYGRQKLAAEMQSRKLHPTAVIARLPLMYGEDGPGTSNVLTGMVQSLRNRKRLTLFTDEYRTPSYAGDVARFLWRLVEMDAGGIFHLGGPQPVSRYDMGMLVAETFGLDKQLIIPARQQDAEVPAPRPRDVSMDSTAAMALGFSPKPMQVILPKLRRYV